MMLALAIFLGTGLILVSAATWLAKSCDTIAERTGVGRAWIGAVLLAGATSLPELMTDFSAVRLGVPDMAAGDLFGSSLANMLILASIDLFTRRHRVLREAAWEHVLVACLAISLTAVAAAFVLVRSLPALAGFSPGSILLLLAYLAGAHAIYRNGRSAQSAEPVPAAPPTPPPAAGSGGLRTAGLQFALAAGVILLSAPAFAWSAKRIAEISGLGTTFVGTLLVGLCTSLPELVASVAAVRLGSIDLAVGNLFGSNAFNMSLFLALDLADPKTPIFAALSSAHLLTALSGIVLMSLGIAAMLYRAEHRFRLLAPSSALMLIVYAGSVWMLYLQAAGS
jgi:cation:H+ antiporter